MNRRRQIELTPEERDAFLEESRTIILASLDPRGFPHVVPMWFCRIDGLVHMTTFRKSQKVVNLRRDPRATLLVESGTTYEQLRGVMLRGRMEIVEDDEVCLDVMSRVQERQGSEVTDAIRDLLRPQAAKRVVLRFEPERISSWDHRKLGGAY